MIRWEGEDQEVNRAELLAIQKAVTLPPPPSGNALTICTDSANSIRQLESMRTKPHNMEHHQQRDLLYAILVNIEALVAAGHTVSLLKVKAHTGIVGNEKADEAAKQACTTGTLTEAWDNNETINVKPMIPDEDSGSRELKGKLAVQKHVTTLLRKRQARGSSRLSAKMTDLQGEPSTWTHQPKTERSFRWEAHHDQAQQTEEEQTTMRDLVPNQQQQANQTRDEEDRQIKAMMEQTEEEEMLLMREVQEHQEHQETEGRRDPTRGNEPEPTEVPPSEEEEIFKELNELAEGLEVTQEEHNDEGIFDILNELIEQREKPQEKTNERQAHHDRVTEESRVHTMMEDPMPRTRWKQRKHDITHSRTEKRNAPSVQEGGTTDSWLNETMKHLKGDTPLHKVANGFWKRATFAARKTILKCRLRILPAQDYETAKNSAEGGGKCTLEGCGHKGVDYAKGFLMRVGHALGGCNNPQMRGMFSDRADAHADELKHILDHHRKGGCKVLAYTGKKRDPGVKPRVSAALTTEHWEPLGCSFCDGAPAVAPRGNYLYDPAWGGGQSCTSLWGPRPDLTNEGLAQKCLTAGAVGRSLITVHALAPLTDIRLFVGGVPSRPEVHGDGWVLAAAFAGRNLGCVVSVLVLIVLIVLVVFVVVPGAVLVLEAACDSPVVEVDAGDGEPEDGVGEHALLAPNTLETYLRGVDGGETHMIPWAA
ncbi:hypothetical protein CYMTET_9007 [Cymbomonas tetramitiformis]|uniref:RNase H type-1 domain-containing protein n=1 Tax=Cymbomonas tetramitiformis TaxID=36881 RepID=A0AAE0GSD7_9CHLO|nr:hypothetical protein CYMTET_9007 [Cymbomonas tetramitiformis]